MRLPIWVVLAHPTLAAAQPEIAPPPHPAFREVVREYERLGLPPAPTGAQLVRINTDLYYRRPVENRSDKPFELLYRIPPQKPGGLPKYVTTLPYSFTFLDPGYVAPSVVADVEPTPAALQFHSVQHRSWENLAFAVQCKGRGWDRLADELYSRARKQLQEEDDGLSVFEALRRLAWGYWDEQTLARSGDRKEALRRLKALAAEDSRFREPDYEQSLKRLELTVAPVKSKPGTPEALIDGLTEYWDGSFDILPREPATYWKLAELGFDAVPALIEHLDDERLTRALYWPGLPQLGPFQLTVGHLCSWLLYDLSARSIGGDYEESYGHRLKPDEARRWFEQARKIGEEKWLLDHAMRADGGKPVVFQTGRLEPSIVRVIGAKYPERLPALYRAGLKQPGAKPLPGNFVNAIVESKLTREQKLALLEEGATHNDLDHRILALEGLARLDRPLLRKHLLATLERIQVRARAGKLEGAFFEALIPLAEAANDRACWDALAAAGKALAVVDRACLIIRIVHNGRPDREDPHRRERIRFLVQFLDDRTEEVDDDGTRTEVRDYAASRLACLLGFVSWPDAFVIGPAPFHDRTQGVVSRLVLRVTVQEAAVRALAEAK